MPGLPRIFNPTPVVVPGQPEQVIPAIPDQVYPDSFLIGLGVSEFNPETQTQSLTVRFRPYNYDTHSLYPDSSKDTTLFIENIWLEAAKSPVFAQIMGGIIQVASLEYQEWMLKQQISVASDPTELAILETKLQGVEAALGKIQPPAPPPPPYFDGPVNVPTFNFKEKNAKNGVVFKNGSWNIIK